MKVLYQTAVFKAQRHSHAGIERCLIMSRDKYFSRGSRSARNALQKLQIAVEMYVLAKTADVGHSDSQVLHFADPPSRTVCRLLCITIAFHWTRLVGS